MNVCVWANCTVLKCNALSTYSKHTGVESLHKNRHFKRNIWSKQTHNCCDLNGQWPISIFVDKFPHYWTLHGWRLANNSNLEDITCFIHFLLQECTG